MKRKIGVRQMHEFCEKRYLALGYFNGIELIANKDYTNTKKLQIQKRIYYF